MIIVDTTVLADLLFNNGAEYESTQLLQTIDPKTIFEVAAQRNLSFYDAAHVWLAITKGIPLYSRDKKLLRSSRDVACKMPKP